MDPGKEKISRHITTGLSNRQKGALICGGPRMCALREKMPWVPSNARGVLRHCAPNKKLYLLRRLNDYLHNAKGVTFAVTPFIFYCLTNIPLKIGGSFFRRDVRILFLFVAAFGANALFV